MKVPIRSKIVICAAVFTALLLFAWEGAAQGTRADYERALGLRKATADKVFKDRVRPRWLPDNTRFWYRNDLPDGQREFILVNAETGERKAAFDHERLAKVLGKATGEAAAADRLPMNSIEFTEKASELLFSSGGKKWKWDLERHELEQLSADAEVGGSLEPGYRIRPSSRNGEATSITINNRTKEELDVFWIDSGWQRQPYGSIKAGGQFKQNTYSGHAWLVTDKSGEKVAVFVATDEPGEAVVGEKTLREPETRSRQGRRGRERRSGSPDGRWSASIKDHNLYVRNVEKDEEIPLTTSGTEEDAFQDRFNWSPDSKKLVVMRVLKGDDRQIHFVESAPKDQLQPKLHTMSYGKPGDRIDVAKPHLFDLEKKREIDLSDALYPTPWSITQVHWAPDSSRFEFTYNQRGHQVLRVVSVEAATGEARTVIDEQSETFIDYSGKQFCQYVDDADEVIWMSERDGWNHLYLYDVKTGRVKNQITKGEWVVRRVERVEADRRRIWFWAGGIRPEQDPYFMHLCRVGFDGKDLLVLTEGNGTHTADFSPDRRFILDRWSRVDLPPVTELCSAEDGRLVCELERADWGPLLETKWQPPEPFVAKGRDGKTDIYGIIIRPGNFDPKRKDPVIEQIYAGPQGAFVPKSFGLQLKQYTIAELGFIVVQIDGMGTSYRSKAFHDVCNKNLGDSGFPDRILWMKAAAAKYPSMDLTRVGVYGGSAGGQSALRALLAHGDFYKVGVADCGCHDNRMDKTWWNEQWMGWPIGPHYEEQSNVTQAHKLQGKLFLTVGEMDRNVDPASTMQVVDALIKADKDFDLLIVPGGGHGVGESPYASRRRMDFFVRHLLGVEPRSAQGGP